MEDPLGERPADPFFLAVSCRFLLRIFLATTRASLGFAISRSPTLSELAFGCLSPNTVTL